MDSLKELVEIEICRRGACLVILPAGEDIRYIESQKCIKNAHLPFNHKLGELTLIPVAQVRCSFSDIFSLQS